MFRVGLFNFSKGVLSPELHGRVDVAAYNAGLREATNVVVLKYGGVQKRPGTRMVYEIKDGPQRLFPFEYSIEHAYALMFGQGVMRPAALGGMVLEDRLTITAITREANARITAAYHGYSVGDEVFIAGVSGMVEINNRFATVTSVIDANNFRIDIDSSGFSAFAADSGGIVRAGPPDPPPVPPVVPPVVPPPPPPPVGGGGGRRNPYEQLP